MQHAVQLAKETLETKPKPLTDKPVIVITSNPDSYYNEAAELNHDALVKLDNDFRRTAQSVDSINKFRIAMEALVYSANEKEKAFNDYVKTIPEQPKKITFHNADKFYRLSTLKGHNAMPVKRKNKAQRNDNVRQPWFNRNLKRQRKRAKIAKQSRRKNRG